MLNVTINGVHAGGIERDSLRRIRREVLRSRAVLSDQAGSILTYIRNVVFVFMLALPVVLFMSVVYAAFLAQQDFHALWITVSDTSTGALRVVRATIELCVTFAAFTAFLIGALEAPALGLHNHVREAIHDRVRIALGSQVRGVMCIASSPAAPPTSPIVRRLDTVSAGPVVGVQATTGEPAQDGS